MLRPYIIGSYEGLKARRITGMCCVYASDTTEAALKLKSLFDEGISAIYITEEFYYDLHRMAEKYPLAKHHVKLLPSSCSGDIGTIKDIKSQITGSQYRGFNERESIAV